MHSLLWILMKSILNTSLSVYGTDWLNKNIGNIRPISKTMKIGAPDEISNSESRKLSTKTYDTKHNKYKIELKLKRVGKAQISDNSREILHSSEYNSRILDKSEIDWQESLVSIFRTGTNFPLLNTIELWIMSGYDQIMNYVSVYIYFVHIRRELS